MLKSKKVIRVRTPVVSYDFAHIADPLNCSKITEDIQNLKRSAQCQENLEENSKSFKTINLISSSQKCTRQFAVLKTNHFILESNKHKENMPYSYRRNLLALATRFNIYNKLKNKARSRYRKATGDPDTNKEMNPLVFKDRGYSVCSFIPLMNDKRRIHSMYSRNAKTK